MLNPKSTSPLENAYSLFTDMGEERVLLLSLTRNIAFSSGLMDLVENTPSRTAVFQVHSNTGVSGLMDQVPHS